MSDCPESQLFLLVRDCPELWRHCGILVVGGKYLTERKWTGGDSGRSFQWTGKTQSLPLSGQYARLLFEKRTLVAAVASLQLECRAIYIVL